MAALAGAVPVTEGLWRGGPDGDGRAPRLVGGLCASCGRHHFPLLGTCPYCSAETVEEAELSARGTLWAWTAVTAPPPGYKGEIPYGFGVVELPEGIRVVSRITEADPARLSFGDEVVLVIVPLHLDAEGRSVVTYAFEPIGDRR